MNYLSDETLMSRVQAGELGLAGLLFERYQQPIYKFLWRSLRDHHLAEDSAQAVFLRMLRYRSSYRAGGSFRAWLFGIAVNERRKTVARRRSLDEVPWSPAADPGVDQTGESSVVAGEQYAAVLRSLDELPDERRELLTLYLWKELSYAELAEVYGLSMAALRVRVHRALSELRTFLVREGVHV